MQTGINRRTLMGVTAGTIGALVGLTNSSFAAPQRSLGTLGASLGQDTLGGPFELPALDYATDSLSPHIDDLTMQIHHTKHHQAFIDNLNKLATDNPEIVELDVMEVLTDLTLVPEAIRTAVRNNLGGHVNHSMFWTLMTPESTEPGEELLSAIEADFGSMEDMQAAVADAGMKRFGSGWTWLVVNDGTLSVVSTPNQDNPVMDALGTPILGIDVWEHAYYLNYQNRRADYLAAWWNVTNWSTVDQAFSSASGMSTPTS